LFLEKDRIAPQISVQGCVAYNRKDVCEFFFPASPMIKSEIALGKWKSGRCSCNFLFRESNIYIVYFKLTSVILTVSDFELEVNLAEITYLHRLLFEFMNLEI
jgi:hypothetical protein